MHVANSFQILDIWRDIISMKIFIADNTSEYPGGESGTELTVTPGLNTALNTTSSTTNNIGILGALGGLLLASMAGNVVFALLMMKGCARKNSTRLESKHNHDIGLDIPVDANQCYGNTTAPSVDNDQLYDNVEHQPKTPSVDPDEQYINNPFINLEEDYVVPNINNNNNLQQ